MSLEQQLQRAVQMANHAKEDRKKAQAAFIACLDKEEQAARAAFELAVQYKSQRPDLGQMLREAP